MAINSAGNQLPLSPSVLGSSILPESAPLPLKVVSRFEIWHQIIWVVESLINIILTITGIKFLVHCIFYKFPEVEHWFRVHFPKFKAELYEDVVLSSAHRHLAGGKTSDLMYYLYDFCKRDKEIPKELLSQIEQAAYWSLRVEKAQDSWFHGKCQKRLEELSEDISESIRNLEEGGSILLPAGLSSYPGAESRDIATRLLGQSRPYALYRVSKVEGKYVFEIHSRDSGMLGEVEEAVVDGKKKIFPEAAYGDLGIDEIANPLFWQALLNLSIGKSVGDSPDTGFVQTVGLGLVGDFAGPFKEALPLDRAEKRDDYFGLQQLIQPFQDRKLSAPAQGSGYHAKRGLCRVQNLWDIVHDKRGEGKERAARRKLRLGIETLYRFFESAKSSLSSSAFLRDQLSNGLRELAQTAARLKDKGQIRDDEWKEINLQFHAIDQELKGVHLKQPNFESGTRSPQVEFNQESVKPPSTGKIEPDDIPRLYGEKREVDSEKSRAAVEYRQSDQRALSGLDDQIATLEIPLPEEPKALIEALERSYQRAEAMGPHEAQHLILEQIFQLKWYFYERNRRGDEIMITSYFNSAWIVETDSNLWIQMSPKDREKCIVLFSKFSELLSRQAEEVSDFMPDRMIGLLKLSYHIQHLAHLNKDHGGLPVQHYISDFDSICINLDSVIDSRIFRLRLPHEPDLSSMITCRKYVEQEGKVHEYRMSQRLPDRQMGPHIRKNIFFDIEGKRIPETEVTKALYAQVKYLKRIRSEAYSHFGRANLISDWGLPIDDQILAAVGLRFALKETFMRGSRQELVQYDAKSQARRAYDDVSGYSYYPENSEELDSEMVRELLLTMDTDLALLNMLGQIEKRPELFANPDVRSVMEILATRFSQMSSAAKIDPTLHQFLPSFFEQRIGVFWELGEFDSALFAIHLANKLRTYWPDPKTRDVVARTLDFTRLVYDKLIDSFREGALHNSSRNSLATEYLWPLVHRDILTNHEVKQLLFAAFVFEHSPINPDSCDPVYIDEIRRRLWKLSPSLKRTLDSDEQMRSALLDQIALLHGAVLVDEPWTGEFPVYSAGNLSIHLTKGLLRDPRKYVPLPAQVMRSKLFKRLFSNSNGMREQPRALVIRTDKVTAYCFLDQQGHEHRIESLGWEALRFYRKFDGKWYEYYSKDLASLGDNVLKKFITSKQPYISVADPTELLLCSSNVPEYRIIVKKTKHSVKKIKTVDDLRPGKEDRIGMTLSHLSDRDPLLFYPLTSLQQASEILVWSKKGVVQEVELPEVKLSFVVRDGAVSCISEPYLQYTVAKNPEDYGVTGLPSFLLLVPPKGSISQKAKLIVPKFDGGMFDLAPSKLVHYINSFSGLFRWVARKILPLTPLSASDDIAVKLVYNHLMELDFLRRIRYFWNLDSEQTKQAWVFDIEPGVDSWNLAPPRAFLDLMAYSISAAAVNGRGAIAQLRKTVRELDIRQLPEDALEMATGAVTKMIGKPSLVAEANYPELVALLLQALFALRRQAHLAERGKFELLIGIVARAYFEIGKHLSIDAELSPEDNEFALQCLKEQGVLNQPSGLNRQVQIAPLRQSLAEIAAVASSSLYGHESPKMEALIYSKSPRMLARGFDQIYEILRGPSDTLRWQQMKYTICVIGEGVCPLMDYLRWLFDQKSPELPLLPDSLGDLRRYISWNDPQYDLLSRKRHNAEIALREFILKLPTRPEIGSGGAHFNRSSNIPQITHHQNRESIEDLERKIQFANSIGLTLSVLDSGFALFSSEEIGGIFSETRSVAIFPFSTGSLSRHPEPSVQKMGREMNDRLTAYQQNRVIRKISDFSRAKELLTEKIGKLTIEAEAKKQGVQALLDRSANSFSSIEKIGNRHPQITWEELRIGFLQNQLEPIVGKMRGVDEGAMKAALHQFFHAETLRKHALFVQKELEVIEKEGLAASSESAEKMYQLLARQRGYDANLSPELLVLEDSLGFLMSGRQIKMVERLIRDPHALAQAVTGAGKTSVIMTMLGLLKADGTNLVTLKFLDPLYPENRRHLEKHLGAIMRKKITPLIFTSKTEIKKKDGTSLFKEMYEDLLNTILQRGCVITNRRTMPLLEEKFISLIDRGDVSDREHIYYLGKILQLMRQRQECIYDEHDKALYPRDEIHLALGAESNPPQFAIDTIRQVFEELILDPRVKANTQADMKEEERRQLLSEVADRLGQKWARAGIDAGLFSSYFKGESSKLLKQIDQLSKEEQDRVVLTKDLIITYLPLTLSQTARQKYILSNEDHVSVIPCEYTEVPREGSQFDNVVERLTYTAQYYYQKGVSVQYFNKWIEEVRVQGFKELQEDRAISSLNDTHAGRLFKSFFPNERLEASFTDNQVKALVKQIALDSNLIGRFLNLIMPQIRIQRRKVSVDAQNQVSMSRASAGISATQGCELGLHPSFHRAQDAEPIVEEMFIRFLERTAGAEPIRYQASRPTEIIRQLRHHKQEIGVVIDGAGALLGVSAEMAARQILADRNDLDAVSYFDETGKIGICGRDTHDLTRKGHHYSHPQSRGADVKLSPSLLAALIAGSGRDSLEVLLQNIGRLRHPDQKALIAVSEESQIRTVEELSCRAMSVQALENSDNLFRSERQKMRDAVRRNMIDQILEAVCQKNVEKCLSLFNSYASTNLLVSEKIENWNEPGLYARTHCEIQRRDKDSVQTLKEEHAYYTQMAKKYGLQDALTFLTSYQPRQLEADLPRTVWNNQSIITGQQAEVETEQQQEAETEVQTVSMEEVYFRESAWYSPDEGGYKINTLQNHLYEDSTGRQLIYFSCDFVPIGNSSRKQYDRVQNRLHHIVIKRENRGMFSSGNWMFAACDIREAAYYGNNPSPDLYLYDVKLKKFYGKEIPPSLRTDFHLAIAQHKFNDGLYRKSDYLSAEWDALEKWLREAPRKVSELQSGGNYSIVELNAKYKEKFFTTQILRNRPKDLEWYKARSDLRQLFMKIYKEQSQDDEKIDQ